MHWIIPIAAATEVAFTRSARWFSLKYIWKAKPIKMSELNDLLTSRGLMGSSQVMVNATWPDRNTRQHTLHVGTTQLQIDGRRRPKTCKLSVAEYGNTLVLFIRNTVGLDFDPDSPARHKNIIAFTKAGNFAFKKRLFGFFPAKLIKKNAVRNGFRVFVGKNVTMGVRTLSSLVDKRQYKELLTKVQSQGLKPISSDTRGELFKLNVNRSEPLMLVKIKDLHLDEVYVHRVPPDMETAEEAVAWMFYKNPETYQPSLEA